MSESQTKAGNQRKFENLKYLKIWKFEILKFKIAQVDPRDMLNNFCFHVYAQKSLFIAENCNAFFWHQWVFFDKTFHLCFFWDHITTLSCDISVHRAGSQLKTFYPLALIFTRGRLLHRFRTRIAAQISTQIKPYKSGIYFLAGNQLYEL